MIRASVEPFPFASLPAISRDEIRTFARLREAASRFVESPSRIERVLGELVSEPVTITARRARAFDAACIPADAIAVALTLLDRDEGVGLHRAVLIDVEAALAASVVARALRQRAPRVIDGSRPPAPELAGAFAALLHAVLRGAHAGQPLRVVAAGPAPVLARELAAMHRQGEAIDTVSLSVTIGSEIFDARVSVPRDLLPITAPANLTTHALEAMGDLPIALPLVIATCAADREMLAALGPGDAFLLPSFALERAGDRLVGPVSIIAARSQRGLAARLGEDGRLMLGSGPIVSHSWHIDRDLDGENMSGEPNTTLQVLEDAPVVVRVELGSIEMSAREWATLAPGDVVTLGRKLGDAAILRVGGVEVARGELVQVDGEYGVRIVGRVGGHG